MATLIGLFRLGRDAELRTTGGGDPVASVALAYNFGRKGAEGKQPTQWIEASLWGERADKLVDYLTKGRQIYAQVEDVHVETYQKRDGGSGTKLTGRIGMLEFAGDRPASAPAPAPAPRAPAPRAAAPAPRGQPPAGGGSGFDDMDDDIPF